MKKERYFFNHIFNTIYIIPHFLRIFYSEHGSFYTVNNHNELMGLSAKEITFEEFATIRLTNEEIIIKDETI